MSSNIIFCPGGSKSQTGVAVSKRYSGVSIKKCGDNVKAVADHLKKVEKGPYVVPVWNSHQGEIETAEYVWDYIQDSKIKITDLWAKDIDFWFVRRTGKKTSYKKIGSVGVAEKQCSGFFLRQNAKLIPHALTTVAHEEYRAGAPWDGVLVAPGQGEHEIGYEVTEKNTANPNNFTSFIRFVPAKKFTSNDKNIKSWLTGVTMPLFGVNIGDITQSFFNALTEGITDFGNFPKLIFVLKRTANAGLLLEGTPLLAGDLLDIEEAEEGEVAVHEDVGVMATCYADELKKLCELEFPDLKGNDFILHRGKGTCLFACPPLSLYTHGYEVNTVKPVVSFYIGKLFQRFHEGKATCDTEQRKFFKRHKKAWEKNKFGFIQFKVIDPV